jgi:hypothetical protein
VAGTLHDELLAIAGIADAEIHGDVDTPAGVKVRLEPGADPGSVGRQVQAVLEHRGLRSRVGGDTGGKSSPPPPPGAPGAVVRLPTTLPVPPPPPAVPTEEAPARSAPPAEPGAEARTTSVVSPPAPSAFDVGAGLASVTVEEGHGGILVTAVAGDGSRHSRPSRANAAAVDEAIVAAVGALCDPEAAPPLLIEVSEHAVEGTTVVLVVVEVEGGRRRAGAAVAEGGRTYAVASAVWAALGR